MQEGQVGLIVLLIAVVITTVAVSVSTRSVSELRISRQEQESTRSLNLAESGVEQLLSQPMPAGTVTNNFTIDSQRVDYQISPQISVSNMLLLQGHTIEVDVTGASNLAIDWPTQGCAGEVEVTLVRDLTYTLSRNLYPYQLSPACASAANVGSGVKSSVPVTGYKIARIKALFAQLNLNMTLTGGTNPLYHQVQTSSKMADGTTRAVQVNKFPGSLPSIFDYVLFSGTQLTKN